jgi:hypothetical protein
VGSHLQLPQAQIRSLITSESTVNNMLQAENIISQPAYEFIPEEAVAEKLAILARKLEQSGRHIPI